MDDGATERTDATCTQCAPNGAATLVMALLTLEAATRGAKSKEHAENDGLCTTIDLLFVVGSAAGRHDTGRCQ